MSRTLSGLFLVGALNRPRKRKRTNRENPRTIPEQIGKIPEKSGKSQKRQKRTKAEGQVQIGKPPRLKPPRLAALDFLGCFRSRPGKPNQRKGQNDKFMNFAHFCEFWCFSLGKQARFTLNFCSRMPLQKVHELTFLLVWFAGATPDCSGQFSEMLAVSDLVFQACISFLRCNCC